MIRSEAQRRAMYARTKKRLTGLGVMAGAVPVGILASRGAQRAFGGLVGRAFRRIQLSNIPTMMEEVAKTGRVHAEARGAVSRAASSLYPQVKGTKIKLDTMTAQMGGGGAFTTERAARATRFAMGGQRGIERRFEKMGIAKGPEARAVATETFKMMGGGAPPTVHLSSTSGRGVLAHELGHASLHLGRGGKALSYARGFTQVHSLPTAAGFPSRVAIGSVAAQPIIAASPLEKKTKRRLHIATAAAPLAMAAPTLIDEVVATRRGAKILRGAGASATEMAAYRKGMGPRGALGTYLLGAAPSVSVGSAGGGAGIGLTAARDRFLREKRRRRRS